MDMVSQLLTRVSGYFNPSTLSGAIDVLVVMQPDGSLKGSPFHARFGKRGILRPRDNLVELIVNEQPVRGLVARLGPAGEVLFSTGSQPPPIPPPILSPKAAAAELAEGGTGHLSEPAGSPTVAAAASATKARLAGCSNDSGSESDPGGGGEPAPVDWRWGQLPQKPRTQLDAPTQPTSASTPPSPSSSRLSLVTSGGADGKGGGGAVQAGSPVDGSQQQQQQLPRQEKSIRLSSEQLQLLGLVPGRNQLQYTITTKFQGTTSCTCAVYLWLHSDRLVVSDIDGTITRSDLLGQLLPMVGKDWTQPMVVRLFNAVHGNGYRFVYLSSRGLGQSEATRRLLLQIRENEETLPDGPILLSPESLLRALHREVIARRPQEFKIPCLSDVRALFPPSDGNGGSPIWAGFGNRPTDADTYAEAGVPKSHCFTVNSRGELLRGGGCCDDGGCQAAGAIASYQALAEIVNHVFPAIAGAVGSSTPLPELPPPPPPPPPPSAVSSAASLLEAVGEANGRSSSKLTVDVSEVNFYLK